MNERIRELILEAGFPKFDKMYVVSDGEELEKFAELIVGECAKIAHNRQYKHSPAHTVGDCAQAIKEHFGVEE